MNSIRRLKNWVVLDEDKSNLVRFSQLYPMRKLRAYERKKNMKGILPLTVKSKLPPQRIAIETTNYCNTSCIFCPHSRMKRPLQHMNRDLYAKVLQDVIDLGVKHVTLGFIGEPLLDIHLFDRIKMAKEAGIETVSIFTNAIILNEERATKLLASGIDDVFVSVDAYNAKRYREMRPIGDYDTVVKNTKFLIKQRDQLLYKNTKINIGMILLNKDDRRHVQTFISQWQDADNVHVREPHAWANRVATLDNKKIRNCNLPCYPLWVEMSVLSNGIVVPCCMDIEGELAIGDAKYESLTDIWFKSSALQELREKHIYKKFNSISLCEKCDITESNTIPWWYYD